MEKEHKSVKEMWSKYLISNGVELTNTNKKYNAWHFCDNEKDADDLAELVKNREKRATTSLYFSYEVEGELLPNVGDHNVITDWQGIAQCIIETKKVVLLPFNEVTEEFAKMEGEGDKSIQYWREVHRNAFKRELEEFNTEFKEDMLVVCEEFEVVYM